MVGHDLELFSKLNGLIERRLSLLLNLDLLGPGLDSLLELRELALVGIKLHVLSGLHEGSDQLTVGFTHLI